VTTASTAGSIVAKLRQLPWDDAESEPQRLHQFRDCSRTLQIQRAAQARRFGLGELTQQVVLLSDRHVLETLPETADERADLVRAFLEVFSRNQRTVSCGACDNTHPICNGFDHVTPTWKLAPVGHVTLGEHAQVTFDQALVSEYRTLGGCPGYLFGERSSPMPFIERPELRTSDMVEIARFEMRHDVRMGQQPGIPERISFRRLPAVDRPSGAIHDLKMPQLEMWRNVGRRSEIADPAEPSLQKKVIDGDQMLEAGVGAQRQSVFCNGYERCIRRVVTREGHGQRARHPARSKPDNLVPRCAGSIPRQATNGERLSESVSRNHRRIAIGLSAADDTRADHKSHFHRLRRDDLNVAGQEQYDKRRDHFVLPPLRY